MSAKKIASPHLDDLAPGGFCKVKRFEKHLCKVVAIGPEVDIKAKLEEMEGVESLEQEEGEADEQPPPKKKPRKESKQSKGRKEAKQSRGKENKTPKHTAKKKPSNILVVGAKMNNEPFKELQMSTPAPRKSPKQSEDIQPSPPTPESPGQLSDVQPPLVAPQPPPREVQPPPITFPHQSTSLLSFSSFSSVSCFPTPKERKADRTPTKSDDGKSCITAVCMTKACELYHKSIITFLTWQMKLPLSYCA